jgi:DNA-binding Lrp family transcriptional regulator
MPVAYVLINAEVGLVAGLVKELRNIEGVVEAYSVAGPYDIVAKVQAERFEQVAEVVTRRVHRLTGIRNTLTLFAFE